MTADGVPVKAHEARRKVDNSDGVDWGVRLGLVCYGVVHLIIAWLAAQLALGDRAGSPDQQGALSELAQKPFGTLLLWVAGIGFFVLVLWQLYEAALGHRDEDGAKRVVKRLSSVGKAVVFGALGYSAVRIAIGGGSDGGGTDTLTARLMAMPGGQLLVGLVGVAVVAVAAAHIYKGFSERFRDHLDSEGNTGSSGTAYVVLGKAGYLSKGVALAIIGVLFLWAAWTHDPDKSGGLDQALQKVLQQPFGAPILLVIALGIACYGLFCFAWARHLDR